MLSAANLEQDYLGLLGVLENDSSSSGAGLAQHIAPHSVRQRVHEFLCSSTWRGVWLGVLDDLPSPETMEDGGLGWLLEEFPWAHGRTMITTRAAAWTQDGSIVSVALGSVEGDEQCKCEECGQCPPALLKGLKCARCKTVYYCS